MSSAGRQCAVCPELAEPHSRYCRVCGKWPVLWCDRSHDHVVGPDQVERILADRRGCPWCHTPLHLGPSVRRA